MFARIPRMDVPAKNKNLNQGVLPKQLPKVARESEFLAPRGGAETADAYSNPADQGVARSFESC